MVAQLHLVHLMLVRDYSPSHGAIAGRETTGPELNRIEDSLDRFEYLVIMLKGVMRRDIYS